LTERQNDRKTERQKGRKTERQKYRKTERQKDRKTERQKDINIKRQKDRKTERRLNVFLNFRCSSDAGSNSCVHPAMRLSSVLACKADESVSGPQSLSV
jgi:hypothetical protein